MVNAKAFKDGVNWAVKNNKGKFPVIIDSNGMHFRFTDNQWGEMFLTYKGVINDEKVIIPYQSFAGIKKMFKYWKTDVWFVVEKHSEVDYEIHISDGDHVFTYMYDTRYIPTEEYRTEEYRTDFGLPFAKGIFNVNEFAESAGRLIPFASTDTCRIFLDGIYIDSENKALVATDGKRLGYLSYESELPSMIVTVNTFTKIDGMGDSIYTVSNTQSDKWLKFENDDKVVVSKLIDGNFPNWKKVVPSTTENSVMDTINLDSFTQAAKYAVDVVDESKRALFENGSFAGISYKHSNDIKGVIALNAVYLKESLEKMKGESVNFYAQTDVIGNVEDMKAIMISDGTLNAIIMPMCKDA